MACISRQKEENMPLVTSKEMLLKAQQGGYAVGAFNAENMEMVKAIIQAAEELKAPVMIQTTPSTIKYGTLETYQAIVAAEAAKASVPVCLHLDHGSSFDLAMKALKAGYTSVMIDGSKLDYEGNIEVSKKVADVAASMGIPCEAELGKVGGKEDDLVAVADTNTDPQEAREFVERTGVTSLAVAIGTAHGFYVGTPVLDKERLSEIREVVDIPLVLHGGSGITDKDFQKAISLGIRKVNIATASFNSLTAHVEKYMESTDKHNFFDLNEAMVQGTYENVKKHILVFNEPYQE
jgi:tagatose 1,6-diphosphate aldolase GatY/KbaY